METAKAWLSKLKSKDKVKSSKKKEATSNVKEGPKTAGGEEALSNITKEKAAAAKLYIENHYKMQMQSLQERKERYGFITYLYVSSFHDGKELYSCLSATFV
jgi:serine/threonine kinase 38